ncbi:nucloid associated Lsr2-like [Streptomyces phage Nanodon]|uniref:Lsr2-like briding protein n=1 Tax=Streptomyces phage Nanodon TaxID=1873777 RepID=A0A1B1PA60_9CAUD|nr:nucloid associated Lsr2-like [Streptomyces phage Nanodon]ANT41054.1 Lsr2-like briding protein [Streptomyces phage Nanodon]
MRNERLIVELVDDIDGTGTARTITFGLDGRRYEIELNKKNEAALRKAMAPWVGAAREAKPEPLPKRRRLKKVDSAAVRQWANENGVEVPATGRIARAVVEQYEAAQQG